MEEAVKETITADGLKLKVEVVDGAMFMNIEATPYELFTIANSIIKNISDSTAVDIEVVLDVLKDFNTKEEGK